MCEAHLCLQPPSSPCFVFAMALISKENFVITHVSGYHEDNKSNYYSQTSLLNTRIEFKSSKEHSTDESSEDEDLSFQLKEKYHVLAPDVPDKVKSFYPNGTLSFNKSKLIGQKENEEGNELGDPKQILYPREKIILDWKKLDKIGSGLVNLGNTCFLNSVLQCLTYCPPLVNYFSSIQNEHPPKCRLNFCMLCLMIKHVNLTLSRQCTTVKPVNICQRLKSIAKHFNFGRQEDAHEFLRYVIDHMWRACLSSHEHEVGIAGITSKFDPLTKSTTAINQIFGGYHRSQVSCSQCKEKSNTYDYFMDFMLDIQNVSSLEEALQKFVTPEILCNDNAYKCSKCKKSVMARKQFTVHRAPNVATFQFKRFDCSRMFGKITKPISYPEKLDLRPYMSDKGPPLTYKLISVLVHLGSSSNSGHYYCYVRNSNNSWYLMDDSSVTQISLNDVLSQRAYVLFYIRVPNNGIQNLNKSSALTSNTMKKSNHIIDALLKSASRGYGDNVKSWGGGVSNLNKAISEDNKRAFFSNYEDEYNEEFDQGKIKKQKKIEQVDLYQNSHIKNNKFQITYHNKYVNKDSHENNFSRNSSKLPKFENRRGFNSANKFNNDNHYKGQHFNKHRSEKSFFYEKNNRYSQHHGSHQYKGGHYRHKSNSFKKKKNKFKHR